MNYYASTEQLKNKLTISKSLSQEDLHTIIQQKACAPFLYAFFLLSVQDSRNQIDYYTGNPKPKICTQANIKTIIENISNINEIVHLLEAHTHTGELSQTHFDSIIQDVQREDIPFPKLVYVHDHNVVAQTCPLEQANVFFLGETHNDELLKKANGDFIRQLATRGNVLVYLEVDSREEPLPELKIRTHNYLGINSKFNPNIEIRGWDRINPQLSELLHKRHRSMKEEKAFTIMVKETTFPGRTQSMVEILEGLRKPKQPLQINDTDEDEALHDSTTVVVIAGAAHFLPIQGEDIQNHSLLSFYEEMRHHKAAMLFHKNLDLSTYLPAPSFLSPSLVEQAAAATS